jgi:ligand-binding sensor domain-containing protein/signal transduction histidine kinase
VLAIPKIPWSLAAAWLVLCGGEISFSLPPPPQFSVASWTVDEDLPDSVVLSILQTRDGYLWLGTPNGLARFDGVHFVVYDDNNTPTLLSRRILRLYEDSQTNLWIATEDSGVRLVIHDGGIATIDIGRSPQEGPVQTICEDATGAVWLYTKNGVLGRYRQKRGDVWKVGAEYPSFNRAVIKEDSGLLWVGTDQALFSVDPAQAVPERELPLRPMPIQRLDFLLNSRQGGYWRLADGRIQKWKRDRLEQDVAAYPWSPGMLVTGACEDQEGNLVVGTYGDGVFWVGADGQTQRLPGLSHSSILAVAVDREGCFWVGSNGGGLSRLKPLVFGALTNSAGFTVQSVCPGADGGLWIGYNGNGRVDHWANGVVEQFTVGPTAADLAVRAVFADRDQTIWAGTYSVGLYRGGLFQLQNGHFQAVRGTESCTNIAAIYQDRKGMLWVGSQGGLARYYDGHWTNIAATGVQAIADDRAGALWLGTEGDGLVRVDQRGPTSFTSANGLPSDRISSLWTDGVGVLWVGTSKGLARERNGQWTSFGAAEPLLSDSIGYLIGDAAGNLWLGSRRGVLRVSMKELNELADGSNTNQPAVRIYEKPDGLPSRQCTQGSQPAACQTRDGKLWFPTIKGLAWVDPTHLNRNTNPPPVVIESVRIDGEKTENRNALRAPQPRDITIPAGKEGLEITYASLNLCAPDKGRFRYRLRDHEKRWFENPWNVRRVHYSHLPQGQFVFEVEACNEDGVWSDPGAFLKITVLPPFWKTWWFLAVTTLGLLGLIVGSVHYVSTQKLQRQLAMLRQQEAVEKERARIARDIHDQLGANLTQVSLLGEMIEADKDHPNEIEAHARQISQTALETTRALDEIVWTVNPSNDTLDGLVTYLCKYAQDYFAVAGIRYRLDAPAELPAYPIPPEVRHNVFLAAKEAITNVVRHARATSACLRLHLSPDHFTIEVEDDGRGITHLDLSAPQTRNGLRNMRKRMEDIDGSFAISPGTQGGALVRLTAPLKNGTS